MSSVCRFKAYCCVLQDIPKILPLILNCVRMIWSLSRFYNTPERLVGLLRKLSNEIINRCCSVISLPDIFNGDVDNVIIALEQVNSRMCLCQAVLQQLWHILLVLLRYALFRVVAVLLSSYRNSTSANASLLFIHRGTVSDHQRVSQRTIVMSQAPL